MAYRKNFSAESRNLLQFNGKSDIAHQYRCLEETFFSSNDLLHKIEIRRENRLLTIKLAYIFYFRKDGGMTSEGI